MFQTLSSSLLLCGRFLWGGFGGRGLLYSLLFCRRIFLFINLRCINFIGWGLIRNGRLGLHRLRWRFLFHRLGLLGSSVRLIHVFRLARATLGLGALHHFFYIISRCFNCFTCVLNRSLFDWQVLIVDRLLGWLGLLLLGFINVPHSLQVNCQEQQMGPTCSMAAK